MEFNEDILKEAVKGFLDRTGYEKIELKADLINMDEMHYDSMKNHTAA